MFDRSRATGPHYQVRLWDLAVVVMGAAVVFDVTRRSRGAWTGDWPDLAYVPGLVALTLAVALGLVVASRGVRQPRAGEVGAWGATWRVVVLGWLAWSVVDLGAALQVRPDDIALMTPRDLAHLRLELIPLMVALGLVGLILAIAPIRPRPRASEGRPWLGSWPSVFLAGLAGVVMLAASGWVIAYLVLLAVDAVWNAMRLAPLVARPPLFDRLTQAGLETLPGLLGCLATATWIDDDLRDAARDPVAARAPRSRLGTLARVATVGLAIGGAAYVGLVSVPRLNPSFAEGMKTILEDSSLTPTVALGFAALAAGFAARSAAHLAIGPSTAIEESPRPFGPWPRRVFRGLAGLVALAVLAAAVDSARGGAEGRWYVPIGLQDWARIILAPSAWLGYPGVARGRSLIPERPVEILFVAASLWIGVRLVILLASTGDGRPSPIDAIAGDRLALGRFLGWWLGLTAAVLASMPLLALAALTLTHYATSWLAK